MRAVLATLALALGLAVVPAPAAGAAEGPELLGAGSTWSQPAIDQWRNEVARLGLSVNYQGVGSSAGRAFYIQDSVDFAVSEIPFYPDERQTLGDRRPFVYLPIVAGGTSMMYHLVDAAGRPVTNLQLSARTAALIFTGRIRTWSDPAITADNNGRVLRDQPITPVIRSDGSGTTAQFTEFLDGVVGDVWDPFMRSQGQPPASTSFYPEIPNVTKAQSGSDGVANYVNANAGSIGYVERAFALQRNRPVASVRNAAGQYTQPTADNVAIALTKARLNSDRTQILTDVYVHPDPRAYPISSYSYMIAPTAGLDAEKGAVLADFVYYFACAGQRRADILGYSPLPPNLVQTAFEAISQVPGAGPAPALNAAECKNPTVTGERTSIGTSTQAAPVSSAPAAAPSQVGAPTPAGGSGGGGNPGNAGSGGGGAPASGAPASGSTPGSPGAVPTAAGPTGGTGGEDVPVSDASTGAADPTAVDPAAATAEGGDDVAASVDDQPTDEVAIGAASASGTGGDEVAAPVTLPTLDRTSSDDTTAPFVLAGLLAVAVVFVPPGLGMARRRPFARRRRTPPSPADDVADLGDDGVDEPTGEVPVIRD